MSLKYYIAWVRTLVALSLLAIFAFAYFIVRGMADQADLRSGDQRALLVAAVMVALWGGMLTLLSRRKVPRRAHKFRWVRWVCVFGYGASFLFLVLLAYLSNGHNLAVALEWMTINLLVFSSMVLMAFGYYQRTLPARLTPSDHLFLYLWSHRKLPLRVRALALLGSFSCGALWIILLREGRGTQKVEGTLALFPLTLALLAVGIGAPQLAKAILNGADRLHSPPDEDTSLTYRHH